MNASVGRPVDTVVTLLFALTLLACGGGGAGGGPDGPRPGSPDGSGGGPGLLDGATRLQPIGVEPRGGDTYRAWGLTGRNKPNGPVERYRRWVPPETPQAIPGELDGHELWIAESADGGWVTLYGRGGAEWRETDSYRARFYDTASDRSDPAVRWDLDLNRLLTRDDLVEIQDLRYDGGDLFLNEACLTYARDADGDCSSLVRVDPGDGRVVWRSRDLVSNNIFLVRGGTVVTGYGFTAEPESVFLLDRADGRVLDAHPLDTAHSYMEIRGDTLHVVTREQIHRFLLR